MQQNRLNLRETGLPNLESSLLGATNRVKQGQVDEQYAYKQVFW